MSNVCKQVLFIQSCKPESWNQFWLWRQEKDLCGGVHRIPTWQGGWMAGSGTVIRGVFSHRAESQQERLHSCRQDSGVLSAERHPSLIFFYISNNFSSVMQYYQKEGHRFVPMQRRSLTLPTKGYSVWGKKTSFYLCGTFLVEFFWWWIIYMMTTESNSRCLITFLQRWIWVTIKF